MNPLKELETAMNKTRDQMLDDIEEIYKLAKPKPSKILRVSAAIFWGFAATALAVLLGIVFK